MSTVFSLPGKLGDSFLQFPVAYWWAKQNNAPIALWLDEKSLKPLASLYCYQPSVEAVEFKPGIENYGCGGQPWHFGMETKDYQGHTVYHLGFRSFPQRQITLETFQQSKVPVSVEPEQLSETPVFKVPEEPKAKRVVLHGNPICPHNRQTPQFWRFLARIRKDLEGRFDEIVFVGNDRDRAMGLQAYPDWSGWSDDGDWLRLASYLNSSELVLACGSSVAALAGALKVPCVRVHDHIAKCPKNIWSNLGKNQLNDTEVGLRKLWPEWFEQHVPVPA